MPTDRTAADELLVVALASGKTVKDAARAAGVSANTAKRRRADPAFMRRVRRARAGMLGEATGKMAAGLGAAVLVLQQLLVDDDPGIRLKAADKLLAHTFKAAELVDLAERVAELERAANTDGDGGDEYPDDEYPDDDHPDPEEGGDDGRAEDPG